jgi:aminopeptidase N
MRKILGILFSLLSIHFSLFGQLDIVYQKLVLTINPDTLFIKGECVIYFKPIENRSYVEFDLNQVLQITSLIYGGTEYPYQHQNHKIRIENNFPSHQLDSVAIQYKGVPDNYFTASSFNQTYHNDVPIIWTLSQPYGCADWWPTQNTLSDKIDSIDIIIHTPEIYKTASIGLLISDSVQNGIRTAVWKHRYPIVPYLVAFASTNYVQFNDTAFFENDTILIMNYVFPEYDSIYRLHSHTTAIKLNYYNRTYGLYPFYKEKYGHAQITGNGGMEHQTMTFISSFSYMLVVHEIAHSWFGNYITCSTWEDIWLNEGFATYTSNLYLDFEPYPNGFDRWRAYCVGSICSQPGGSVWVNDTTVRNRIFSNRLSYEKAGMLLQMIHYKIGDSLYYETMKQYLNHPDLAYGFASNQDFFQILETVTNIDFQSFFDYWYWGEGYPSVHIKAFVSKENKVLLSLKCTNSSTNNIPFEGNVDILLKNQQKDTLLRLPMKAGNNNYELALGFMPDSIVYNPYFRLISPQKREKVVYTEDAGGLLLYPNPANDVINIMSLDDFIEKITIFDSSGRKIKFFELPDNSKTLRIETSFLSKGVYFVQVQNNKNNILVKYFAIY